MGCDFLASNDDPLLSTLLEADIFSFIEDQMAKFGHLTLLMTAMLSLLLPIAAQYNEWQLQLAPPGAQFDRSIYVLQWLQNGSSLFIHGGLSSTESTLSDSWLYDYTTNSWQKLLAADSDKAPQRAFAVSGAVNSTHVALFGGISG